MARYEKQTKIKYFNANTYKAYKQNAKRYTKQELYDTFPEKYPPGSLESITVPGQAVTVKQLMERYEKGRPVPVE